MTIKIQPQKRSPRRTKAKVIPFPATNTMNVGQALDHQRQDDLQEVLILGFDKNGEFVLRSSRMNKKDGLWLIELARNHILNRDG